jgi:hypothetical protein
MPGLSTRRWLYTLVDDGVRRQP